MMLAGRGSSARKGNCLQWWLPAGAAPTGVVPVEVLPAGTMLARRGSRSRGVAVARSQRQSPPAQHRRWRSESKGSMVMVSFR
ncbi:hypothetical protein BHE74_00044968 [Ensete ventricosum]|nr:hypothetical protein GW17_00043678 [Ensete ventricosum]RWW48922.1 hypothetical protein BHE74_00044968 [Ensete ventricosum]